MGYSPEEAEEPKARLRLWLSFPPALLKRGTQPLSLTHRTNGACILRHLSRLLAWRPGSSTASWGIASSQISAVRLEMGKAQSLLSASSHPGEPPLGGPGGKKAITGCGSCLPGRWGVQSPGCRSLPEGGIFAAPGCQGSEDCPAQLGCIGFGCTEWKILACRQNRRCEEKRGAASLVQELGLKQHAPHGAELCQLWAAGEPCRHRPTQPALGIAFTAASSPGHASWKSLKVASPLCLPTACPGGRGMVQCAAACLSRDNREVASNRPLALKMALFYNKHSACCWQVVTAKQKA